MKRTLTLNLLLFFVIWGTFKSAESLLRIAGSQEMYSFYNIEWLYFVIVAFSVLGGLALAYAIWKAKPWGYALGFAWLIVAIINSIFTGAVAYFNKPFMTQIFITMAKGQGRDVASIEGFINSPLYMISTVGASAVMVAVILFFMWHLFARREYFNQIQ